MVRVNVRRQVNGTGQEHNAVRKESQKIVEIHRVPLLHVLSF